MGTVIEKIKHYKTVALDTNLLIYLMEKHPVYLDEVAALFKMIETGNLLAVSSILLLTEILIKPLKDNNRILISQYKAFISTFPNLKLRNVDYDISISTAKVRAKYGLRIPDAVFIATAIEEKAEAYITNDTRLNCVKEIIIVQLSN